MNKPKQAKEVEKYIHVSLRIDAVNQHRLVQKQKNSGLSIAEFYRNLVREQAKK